MARKATGEVFERKRKDGRRVFALRFRAYGKRQYVTLGSNEDGWTRAKAEGELENVLADVRRGIWQPEEAVAEPVRAPEPTFHEFASEWLASREHTLRPKTVRLYRWQLVHHLLPFFAKHRLSEITVSEVDRYRTQKVRERERGVTRLSNGSINKTIGRLAQVLEVAVEYGHMAHNPAVGRRRRLKAEKPQSGWLVPEQVAPLLRAAGELDAAAKVRRADDVGGRRALLATLVLAGLRVGEALALRWRDVELASGKLKVGESKTAAGVRSVDLSPDLRDELATFKAGSPFAGPSDLVFSTKTGRPQNSHNVLNRVLRGAVELANVQLREDGVPPIPEKLKTHELRHSFASLLFEAGASVPYVMAQIGHADPKVTLSVYSHVLERKRDHGERLDALVRGAEWSPTVTSGDSERSTVEGSADRRSRKAASDAAFLQRPRQDSNLRPAA